MGLFRMILLVAAFLLFMIDAILLPQPARPRLTPLGLACATLAFILPGG